MPWGDGTLSYQWQKDGDDLTNGGHYSGATTATLTVSNADGNDEADYRCVVTSGCGDRYSDAVALTLYAPTPADLDDDCDVDQDDFVTFGGCLSGSAVPHNGSEACQQADFDDDNDVDQSDFGIFQRCLSGEDQPADPNCAN